MVQTMVADRIPFERRGQAMGIVMAAFSLSTVAGVPLGLLLANHFSAIGWRAPFFFIALLSGGFFFIGYRRLPAMTSHLDQPKTKNALKQILDIARQANHLKAFGFIVLMMLAGFTVIPYVPLNLTANVGIAESFIAVVYLCGGVATFFTARLIGRLADRFGKLRIFQWVAVASFVPVLITTHLAPVPWWVVLCNSTVFFILVPGRMIPAMAMVGSAAAPQVRGRFSRRGSPVLWLPSGGPALLPGSIIPPTPPAP